MKRLLFIVGILIIVLLTGVLIFLLFANEATKEQVFSTFDFGGTELGDMGDTIVDLFVPEDTSVVALRQLTMKPTIGSQEITPTASSTATVVYFAEAGTGHIFALDVIAGNETRISNITIPTAERALISRDGSTAVIASDDNQGGATLTVVLLATTTGGAPIESYELAERVEDFSLTSDNYLLYTTSEADSVKGKRYSLTDKTTVTLFDLPFREAVILWGNASTDTLYATPKTSAQLEGALYSLSGGVLQRTPLSGYGFSASTHSGRIFFNLRAGSEYRSFMYLPSDDAVVPLATAVLPEKCASAGFAPSVVVCGSSYIEKVSTFPDDWYRGTLGLSDDLWLTDTATGAQSFLASPLIDAGRELDVISPEMSQDEQRFYFINKNDRSLWLLDRVLLNNE